MKMTVKVTVNSEGEGERRSCRRRQGLEEVAEAEVEVYVLGDVGGADVEA